VENAEVGQSPGFPHGDYLRVRAYSTAKFCACLDDDFRQPVNRITRNIGVSLLLNVEEAGFDVINGESYPRHDFVKSKPPPPGSERGP
ncbi:hypothetical protein ACI3PL_14075, partial [Lacticaseibacillus paracasei]